MPYMRNKDIKGDHTMKQDAIGNDNIGGTSRKMTSQEKLGIVVQGMVEGGNLGILSSPVKLRYLSKDDRGIWMIQFLSDLGITHEFSINDLLSDAGAMRAAYKTCKYPEWTCEADLERERYNGRCLYEVEGITFEEQIKECGIIEDDIKKEACSYYAKEGCNYFDDEDHDETFFTIVALEALKLLHDPEKTSEDAIEYLYINLPKV
jgi:hypothetical protein